MKVVITAPSLDEATNVSGISTVVRQIVEKAHEKGTIEYVHFVAGKKDREKRGFRWLFRQLILPFRFYRAIKHVDVVHINTALNLLSILRDFILVKTSTLAKKPVLIHVHGGKFLAEEFSQSWLKALSRRMLKSAKAVLVLSETEQRILERKWSDLKTEALQNAVPTENFFVGVKRPNSILFMGRLHESKGLDEIIEAFQTIKDQSFTFSAFGNGVMRDVFVRKMSEILDERFYFGGIVSGAEKSRILAETDIFILPSRYGEGLPMALLEAMASGCIVIASSIASVSEVIQDGVNGFLIKPQDAHDLVQKLTMILKMQENEKSIIRQNARKTVESRFDLKFYIERLETIYMRITENEGKSCASS